MALMTVNRSQTLIKLLIVMLKHLRCSVTVTAQTWFRVLVIVLNRRGSCFGEEGSPLKEMVEEEFFSEVSLDEKVLIMQYLCDWILEESPTLAKVMHENRNDDLFLVSSSTEDQDIAFSL